MKNVHHPSRPESDHDPRLILDEHPHERSHEAGWDRRPARNLPLGAAEIRDDIPCTRAAADHWLR